MRLACDSERRTRVTHNRFGANVVTLSPVGSQLAIVDGQQRYRREARHTKNNSTELPREGRGRWREKERKETKQKEREKREGESRGSWFQKRGRKERTNTRRETCARVFVREGEVGEGGEMQPMHFTGACLVLDFAPSALLPHENKTDTRVETDDRCCISDDVYCRTPSQLISNSYLFDIFSLQFNTFVLSLRNL